MIKHTNQRKHQQEINQNLNKQSEQFYTDIDEDKDLIFADYIQSRTEFETPLRLPSQESARIERTHFFPLSDPNRSEINRPSHDLQQLLESDQVYPSNNHQNLDHKLIPAIDIYKPAELDEFCEFISHIYLKASFEVRIYTLLSPKNKTLAKIFLQRVFKTPERALNEFSGNVRLTAAPQKRNEEKAKIVYKAFLKQLRLKFLRKYTQIRQDYLGRYPQYSESIFADRRRCFYFWLFTDTIRRNSQPVDLVMDICCGAASLKKTVSKSDNWEKKTFGAMRTVSAGFLCLLKNDYNLKRRLLQYLSDKNHQAVFDTKRGSIRKKLERVFSDWKRALGDCKHHFETFQERFTEGLSSLKMPWSISELRDSIEYCATKITSKDNDVFEKFSIVKQRHYST